MPFGVDVAVGVDAQHVLREVLRCLAPNLLAARIAVEARVVTGAIQGVIGFVVAERKSLVRTDRREADDVAVRADAGRHALAELQEHARRILVGIGNVQRLVDLEVANVGEPVRGIIHPAGAGALSAGEGTTVAAATPAAARPAPLRNFRRPASIILGQLSWLSSLCFRPASLLILRLPSGPATGGATRGVRIVTIASLRFAMTCREVSNDTRSFRLVIRAGECRARNANGD